MSFTDTARVALAAARLTRAIVADDVPGQWWIKDPIDEAMRRYRAKRTTHVPKPTHTLVPSVEFFDEPWWWKYRDGLDCPWCVGFWIGAGVLLAEHTVGGDSAPAPLRAAWRFVTAALALNAVVAPVGSYLGIFDNGDEE